MLNICPFSKKKPDLKRKMPYVFSPPQDVRSNVRFKLTFTNKKVSIYICANIETNISSVKKYIYVRFPIFLTGKWEMKTPKKNFEALKQRLQEKLKELVVLNFEVYYLEKEIEKINPLGEVGKVEVSS